MKFPFEERILSCAVMSYKATSFGPREDPGGPTYESTHGRADESKRRSSRESLRDFSREDPRGNTREITRSERLEDTRTRFDNIIVIHNIIEE